jgi:hypothetical protein
MDTDEDENSLSDEQLDASFDDAKLSEPRTSRDVRLDRLDEFEATGAEKTDPLQALLTFTSADLLNVAFLLGDAVKSTLGTGPVTEESARQGQAVLNDYLRVTRQVDRFTQLELRIESARLQAEDARKRAKSTTVMGHFQQSPRRRH